MDASQGNTPWYARAFGPEYLIVYGRRTAEAAREEAAFAADRLGLAPGAAVLDLCCGPGFHLEALRELGFQALGVDLSSRLLETARRKGPVARGDMRRLPFRPEAFDGVLSFFTTFGYFQEDRENLRVLEEIARVLAPGGRLFLDYLNPPRVRDGLVPQSERRIEGILVRETRWIRGDPPRVHKRVEILPPRGGSKVYTESVRLYEREAMEALLRRAGLTPLEVLGDFRGAPYSADSPRMILTAEGRMERPAAGPSRRKEPNQEEPS